MPLTRREVLKWVGVTAAAGPLLPAMERIAHAIAERPGAAPIVWYNAGGDHNNFLAQLGHAFPSLMESAAIRWNLVSYDPLVPGVREPSPDSFASAPIVILESLPPSGADAADGGDPIATVIGRAKAAIFLGTDACYGGTRWTAAEVESAEALCRRSNVPMIKLPGVPVPPHHLIGTLGYLEFRGIPDLDRFQRPQLYYGETVCMRCERRWQLENGEYAESFGDAGCLLRLGCKGPIAHNSCAAQRWNGGENWCVGAGGPCTACSEPGYPLHGGLGLYGRLAEGGPGPGSSTLNRIRAIGWGFVALAAAGVGLKLAHEAIDPIGQAAKASGRDRRESSSVQGPP